MSMNKILVSYFSTGGTTKTVAEKIAKVFQGDLFEIEPVDKYTEEDLDWTNPKSRSSIEMQDKSSRPTVLHKALSMKDYDTVVIGFPVWWYTAPTIINTFIEENDLTNKNVYIFVTSGGSGFEESLHNLQSTYPTILFVKGIRFSRNSSDEEIMNFLS